MYLFFDTETTGLPKNWKAPLSDFSNWPRIVQIAWVLTDENGNELDHANHIIKPVNFVIPPEVSRIHGITTEKALSEGVDLHKVLTDFSNAIGQSKLLIAHNLDFDRKVTSSEFLRLEIPNNLSGIASICTKEIATEFCQLPGKYGFKWPTLQELHHKLFNKDIEKAHDAYVDVMACLNCFFELKNKGIITMPELTVTKLNF